MEESYDKMKQMSREMRLEDMISVLPQRWQDQLRPQIDQLLEDTEKGEAAAIALVKEKALEWSAIEGQKKFVWDDDLGPMPVM
jgi:hypothetical protein